MRCGEYKMVLSATSDNATDAFGTGGFTGVLERYAYPKLFNLYLDPKEQHNYLTRKLAYIEAFQLGMRNHLGTFEVSGQEDHGHQGGRQARLKRA